VRLPASLVAILALLALTGCQHAPPPARPALVLPLPPAAPPAPPPLPREAATWHFTTAHDACTASASGRTTLLRITAQAGRPATFALFARHGTHAAEATAQGALRFQGAAGGWSALARIGPGSEAIATLPLNDQAVGRIALLLAGGTLTPVGAGAILPTLLLPPAGAPGRHWFACARGLLS